MPRAVGSEVTKPRLQGGELSDRERAATVLRQFKYCQTGHLSVAQHLVYCYLQVRESEK